MPLEIATPTREDAQAITNIHIDSLHDETFTRSVVTEYPVNEAARKWFTESEVSQWDGGIHRVARDTDTGAIVSCTKYDFVATDNGVHWKKAVTGFDDTGTAIRGEQLQKTANQSNEVRIRVMGNTSYMRVTMLATSPAHQRRGAASLLMQHVVDLADKYNLPTFLIATRSGRPLYDKFGFVEKESIQYDMSVINEPAEVRCAMVRPKAHADQPSSVPSRPLQPIEIVPLEETLADCIIAEQITKDAFGPDPLVELGFGGAEQEPTEVAAGKLLDQLKQKEFVMEKAIDTQTGEMIGFAKWMVMEDPHKDVKPFGNEWPRGANLALCNAMFGEMETRREKYFQARNEPYVYMAALMIHPKAHRRGVGSALLRRGLALNDARGWKTYITASPSGAPLYRKFGWKDYTTLTINLKDFGGDDKLETAVGLIREPHASEVSRADVAT